MGTNALPVIGAGLTGNESRVQQMWSNLRTRLFHTGNCSDSSSVRVREQALAAASILGQKASPLLHELADSVGVCDAFSHVSFLAGFKTEAIEPITTALANTGNCYGERALLEALNLVLASNQLSRADKERAITTCIAVLQENWDEFVDREAAWALGTLKGESEPAIPVLLKCLTNREPKSSSAAAWALGETRRRPEIVLPALAQSTGEEKFHTVGEAAVRAIGSFGTNATAWLPLLVRRTGDREREVRDVARLAVHLTVRDSDVPESH